MHYDILASKQCTQKEQNIIFWIRSKDAAQLKVHLDSGVSDACHAYLLLLSASFGAEECFQLITSYNRGLQDRNAHLLYAAAKSGSVEILRQLHLNQFDLKEGDDLALRLASDAGHLQAIDFLLSKGAVATDHSEKLLVDALTYNSVETVQLLNKYLVDLRINHDAFLEAIVECERLEILIYMMSLFYDAEGFVDKCRKHAIKTSRMKVLDWLNAYISKKETVLLLKGLAGKEFNEEKKGRL